MANVYMVTAGCYSDYGVKGLFTTRAKAEEYIRKCKGSDACSEKDFNEIVEWPLNRELQECEFTRWSVGIMLDDGSVAEGPHEQQYWGIPESKSYIAENVPFYKGRGIARAESHKSKEHALKVAIEARQEYLRKAGGGQ